MENYVAPDGVDAAPIIVDVHDAYVDNVALPIADDEATEGQMQMSPAEGTQEPVSQNDYVAPTCETEAIRGLLSNIAKSASTLLPILSNTTVTNAECRIIDVDSATGTKRRC